jgi:hypothetical protein
LITTAFKEDLKEHLARDFGLTCCDRYWAILERLFVTGRSHSRR